MSVSRPAGKGTPRRVVPDATNTASRFRYFVAISPGLESLLLTELDRIGIAGKKTPGGVECSGPIDVLWSIHHQSRLAESVRLRLRSFEAKSFLELEQNLRRLPWHAYLRHNCPFTISVTCQSSRLYHTQAIAERVRRVVCGHWDSGDTSTMDGVPPPAAQLGSERGEQKLHVRVAQDVVQVSVDASGERLHRRGYRTHVGPAPLRETLAAATIQLLLAAAPNAPIHRLWDPFCGSGTLLSEWLLMDVSGPRHSSRAFAFESWPIHDPHAYANWIERLFRPAPPKTLCRAFGSDKDSRCIAAARHNLARANVIDRCTLLAQDFRLAAAQIPEDTAVAANLPYGIRLTDRTAASQLFSELDRLLCKRRDLRPVVVLNILAPPRTAGCSWRQLATFANGGLRVTAWGLD